MMGAVAKNPRLIFFDDCRIERSAIVDGRLATETGMNNRPFVALHVTLCVLGPV